MQNAQGLFVVNLSSKRPQVQVSKFSFSNISDVFVVEELVHGSEEKPKKKDLIKLEFHFLLLIILLDNDALED